MTRTPVLLLLLAVVACSGGPRLPRTAAGAPVLEVKGAVKGGPYQIGTDDLAHLPRRTVRGIDPATGREASFEGPDLGTLLVRMELKPGADILVLRTADKRAVPVPLSQVRQYRPVLAERVDGAPVEGRLLAWPNAEQRGLATDPRASQWWARDLVALEVVNAMRTYGRALAVPEAVSEGARIGAGTFGWRCTGCHQVRGVGGQKGPDLTHTAERMDVEALRALLQHHPGWIQPGLEPPGDEAPSQLHAFLRAAAAQSAVAAETGSGNPPDGEGPDDEEHGGKGKKHREEDE